MLKLELFVGHLVNANAFFQRISDDYSHYFEQGAEGLETTAPRRGHKPSSEANWAMWTLFHNSLRNAGFSQERLDRIGRHYHLDFEAFPDRPLRIKDVARFYLGLYEVTSRDLREQGLEHPKQRPVEEIAQAIQALRPAQIVYQFPHEPIGAFYDPMAREQQKYQLLVDLHEKDSNTWMERVTKTLSTMELRHKQIIPIQLENGTVEYYKVYAKIARGGLVAYALKPLRTEAPLNPMLIFRPTMCAFSDENMISNWQDNFYWDYGFLGYTAASAQLEALIRDEGFCPGDKKIEIGGYSLGSAHAQYFIANTPHKEKIASFTSYNAPGPRPRDTEAFAAYIDAEQAPFDHQMHFKAYRTDGDPLQKLGGPHLGSGVTNTGRLRIDIDRATWPNNPSADELHQRRRFDHPPELEGQGPQIENFDNQTAEGREYCETYLRRRRVDIDWAERLRPLAGLITRFALTVFGLILRFFAFMTCTTIVREGRSYGPVAIINA